VALQVEELEHRFLPSIVGPVYPPPGGVTFSATGSSGSTGGRTGTYTNFNFSGTLYWGPSEAGIRLDGQSSPLNEFTASQLDLPSSNLAGGVARWVLPNVHVDTVSPSGGILVTTRLTLTVTTTGGSSIALTNSLPSGLSGSIGVVMQVPGSFNDNFLFEVNDPSSGQWVPAVDWYNSQSTGSAGTATSFGGGFWYPQIDASKFLVSAPSNATAGTAINVTVTATDLSNNIATAYSGTVTFSSNDGQAVLPGNSTLSNGTGVFSVTLKTAGSRTITATDTATSSITGTSNSVTVSAVAANHFLVSGPSSATAGTALTVTVTAQDPFNNTATGYTGSVHFSSNDGQAGLPGNSALTNGTGTFSATLKTAGSRTITATDTVTPGITGTSAPIVVNAAAASKLLVSAPAAATAGTPFTVTVTAQDPFNNTASSYSGTVSFSSNDGQAVLPGNSPLSNGTGSFSATLKTAGSRTLTATDTVTLSIKGTSGSIAVSAAAASKLLVSAPASTTAGTAITVTVTAQDPFNNTATSYSGMVHFSSSDGQASLPGNSTLSSGTGTFSATLKTAGSQTITATDTVNSTVTGKTGTITVNVVATRFLISAPASTTAGMALTLTVTAQDAFNNTATGYAGSIHFTSTDGQASLPGNSTLSNGTGTFSATLRTAGTQTVTATDTVSTSLTGTSGSIAVSAGAPVHLVFGVQPGTAVSGHVLTPSVTVRIVDQFNNLVSTDSTDQVTLGIASGPSTNFTSGTTTRTASGGIATFSDLVLTTPGPYNLSENGTSGLFGPVSNSFQVVPQILQVSSFTQTSTGFTVTFNEAFVPGVINLYDAASANYGPADVTLVGQSTGAVKGSLIIDPTNTIITFVKTGGVLAADNYSVTLVSGSNAFVDSNGIPLDGNGDFVPGDNYANTFSVASSAAVVVSVPDFARGLDATDPINLPNNSSNGIPITLSNGAGVTDGTFVLQYNANLLTITGGTVNSALTGATFTVTPSGSGTSAQATIVFHSSTALAAGAVRLGGLTATVPNNAPYRAKELLHFSSVSLNGSSSGVVGADGVHVVAYFGDTSGDGTYSGLDAALASRVSSLQDSGFAAYRLVDPVIIADINANGRLDGSDASFIGQVASGTGVSRIPPIPSPAPPIVPGGPDPTLSIPTDLQVGPGGVVEVPVNLDTAMPAGSLGLTEANLALVYDPTVLTVAILDIHLGTLPNSGSGWSLSSSINSVTGEVGINLFSTTPLAMTSGGSLVTLAFHVQPSATLGATSIHLTDAVNPSGSLVVRTSLDDAQGGLTLHPSTAAAPNDGSLGGIVTITGTSTSSAVGTDALTLANTASFLDQPGAPEVSALAVSAPANSAVTEVYVLDQFFQGMLNLVSGGRLPARVALMPSAELDAALTSLLHSASVPPLTAVRQADPSEALVLDDPRGDPDWLQSLAQAMRGHPVAGEQPDSAADDPPQTEQRDQVFADTFCWDEDAARVAMAQDPQ
jgi:hypothetical protein